LRNGRSEILLDKETDFPTCKVRMMSDTVQERVRQAREARRENRLDDVRQHFLAAVELSRQIGTRRELVDTLKGLAQIERDLGRLDVCRPLYEEAVALCRMEGDALLLAHTVRHLGDIHRVTGCLELAEPCYLEALALYRAQTSVDPLQLANAIRPMAILKDQKGEVEEAARLWEEAKALYTAAEVPAGVAECSARLGRRVL
jgi:tetratricopeptide (TPR) repeat protein